MSRLSMSILTFGWILSIAATSCTSAGTPLIEVVAEVNDTLSVDATPILAPGDTLSVTFPSSEQQWSHMTTVRADGMATFNLLGAIHVQGETVESVNATVKERYSAILTGPEVTVHLATMAARGVHVIGEVMNPGEVLLEGGRLSLLDSIGRAGGFMKATAAMQQVVLVRFQGDGRERLQWTIDCRRDQWVSEPLLLQPYDMVFVPNTTIDKVDIWVDQYIRRLIPLPGAAAMLN